MKVACLVVAVALAAAAAGEESKRERNNFLDVFAVQSTTTYTVISASTSTVFYSCLSGSYTALICKGRKRKSTRAFRNLDSIDGDASLDSISLDSSSDAMGPAATDRDDSVAANRFGYTVWTTSKTTSTVTLLYTNTASTIKISYYCDAGGVNYPPGC
ncbi:uncharacterized protein [Penaeus vannamei]|uniref:uncharacterized protein n=1 Tax=Penaeus vannamei TaxID=6689 RepID=UPI00387F93F1